MVILIRDPPFFHSILLILFWWPSPSLLSYKPIQSAVYFIHDRLACVASHLFVGCDGVWCVHYSNTVGWSAWYRYGGEQGTTLLWFSCCTSILIRLKKGRKCAYTMFHPRSHIFVIDGLKLHLPKAKETVLTAYNLLMQYPPKALPITLK